MPLSRNSPRCPRCPFHVIRPFRTIRPFRGWGSNKVLLQLSNMAMDFLREEHESCLLTLLEFPPSNQAFRNNTCSCVEYWKCVSTYLVGVSNPPTPKYPTSGISHAYCKCSYLNYVLSVWVLSVKLRTCLGKKKTLENLYSYTSDFNLFESEFLKLICATSQLL